MIKDTLRRALPKSRFARSVSILAGGTAAGQAITILASPLLTRLYSPEDFGLLAVFVALLGIFGVIASLRYQLAIPLPESDEEAAHVVVLSLIIVAAMSLLATVLVIFFAQPIADVFNIPALASYLWLLPLGLLLSGIYQVFNYWAIRVKAFTPIARTKLTQAIVAVTVKLGAYTLGPLALLLSQVTGQAVGTTSLGALTIRNRWGVFKAIRWRDIRAAAKRYVRFPIYSTWGGLFNTAGQQLPPILFAILFSPAAAGIYMIAHRVLAMPMSLIGKAIADVFFSSAAEARRNGNLAPLVADIHAKLAHIAMPPALILILAGPDLFAFVFGADWRQAGEFARWMSVYLFFNFIASPLSTLNSVMEKQAQALSFQTVLLVSRISALGAGAVLGDIILAVAFFSFAGAICWFFWLLWILVLSGNRIRLVVQTLSSAILSSIFVCLPLLMFFFAPYDSGLLLILALIATGLASLFYYKTIFYSFTY